MGDDESHSVLAAALVRLEAKVDKIDAKGDARDQQSYQMQEFIGLLKQQLHYLQTSMDELKLQIATAAIQADKATSTVRMDVERQIKDRTDEGNRVHAAQEKDIDALRETSDRVFARLNALDRATARLYGGVAVCGALGLSGLYALLKGVGG